MTLLFYAVRFSDLGDVLRVPEDRLLVLLDLQQVVPVRVKDGAGGVPQSVERLDDAGVWRPVGFRVERGEVRLDSPVESFRPGVFRREMPVSGEMRRPCGTHAG